MDTFDIPKEIADLRKKAKLTQKEIAIELGCSQANVSYLQNTKAPRARPSAKVVDGLKRLRKLHSAALDLPS